MMPDFPPSPASHSSRLGPVVALAVSPGVPAPATCARLALGFLDAQGRAWMLHREHSLGNMLRTQDPTVARTWSSIEEAGAWLDRLPDHARAQLADRRLYLWPLTVTRGPAVYSCEVRTIQAPDLAAGVKGEWERSLAPAAPVEQTPEPTAPTAVPSLFAAESHP